MGGTVIKEWSQHICFFNERNIFDNYYKVEGYLIAGVDNYW